MAQYIDRAALVAEIERRKYQFVSQAESFRKIGNEDKESYFAALASNMNNLSCFLDTLEVEEVDLEGEVESYWKQCDLTWCRDAYTMSHIKIMLSDIAKHFFELGLKAKGE